ncbi:MAG: FadR family transcriptional regulator [Syntrophus sp. (in: bacteria)]|nr:FadR family transcriptional regulator [Syntrophus sp. (in: bacteria)]
MGKFKPIRPARKSEEVGEQLKQSILNGVFRPGDKLPSERDMAEEFQVSRVAIREALRRLENTGFIITRQGVSGGAFITDLTFQNLASAFLDLFMAGKMSIPELHEVRHLVEPKVARMAALRVTPEYTRVLKEALERERGTVTTISEEVDRKTRIHYILAEMCGNRVLEALMKSVLGLSKTIVGAIEPYPVTLHPAGMHEPIVNAVLAEDPEAAASAMERHTIEFGENLIKMEKTFRQKKPESPFPS